MKLNNILYFYKYQSLSEEKHFEFLRNYLSQKIWLTSLKNFNDPFEGRFSFVSFSPEYILTNPKIFDELLKQHHINGEPDLTVDEFKKRLKSPESGEALKNSSQIVKNIFSNHGALCLTTKNNNIPMWAYYADNHKGCCIVFELDFDYIKENAGILEDQVDEFKNNVLEGRDILSFNLKSELDREFAFVKVRYSEDLPVIECDKAMSIKNRYDQSEYIIRNSVGVKFKQWEHECEYRLVTNSNSESAGLLQLNGYAPFLKVTGVILGSQIDKDKEKIIRDLCRKNSMYVHKAICSENSYEIIINKCSSNENTPDLR